MYLSSNTQSQCFYINSLPLRLYYGFNFTSTIYISVIDMLRICNEIGTEWMPQDSIDDKSESGEVMVYCY